MANKAQSKQNQNPAAPAAEAPAPTPAIGGPGSAVGTGGVAMSAATAPAAPVASVEPPAPPLDPDTSQAPAAVPKLKDFIREHEQAAQELGIVVAKITHPDASGDVYQGVYSGIRTAEGDPSAIYSDGSTH